MKSLRLIAIAAVAALSSLAHAADSQNLTVTATVSGTCKLTAVPGMGFTLDPAAGGAATSTSTVQYKCTKGLAAGAFTVGGSANGTTGFSSTLTNASVDTIAFTLNWPAPTAFTGTGFGAGSTAGSVLITGSIAGTAYQNVSAGTYTRDVAITIAP